MWWLWEIIKHFYLRAYLYIWANLAFVIVSLPIITIPLAWAALVRLSQLAQSSPHVDLHDFWQALRENLWQGLGLGLVTALLVLINLSNLYTYQHETGLWFGLLRGLWIGTLFIWFSVQIYLWPLYYAMETPRLLLAIRNAFVMLMLNPVFTILLWLIMLILGFLSSFLPLTWILLTVSFFACLCAGATLNRLERAGIRAN